MMGNLTCGLIRKKTSQPMNKSDADKENGAGMHRALSKTLSKPKEEVIYATVDHGNSTTSGSAVRIVEGDDCDYALVKIPSDDRLSIKEDCSDDYVLMG